MSPCWTWIVGIFLFRFFSQTIFICRKNMYPNITQHVYWHPIQKHFPHKKVNVVPIPFTITISHPHHVTIQIRRCRFSFVSCISIDRACFCRSLPKEWTEWTTEEENSESLISERLCIYGDVSKWISSIDPGLTSSILNNRIVTEDRKIKNFT